MTMRKTKTKGKRKMKMKSMNAEYAEKQMNRKRQGR